MEKETLQLLCVACPPLCRRDVDDDGTTAEKTGRGAETNGTTDAFSHTPRPREQREATGHHKGYRHRRGGQEEEKTLGKEDLGDANNEMG